MFESTNKYVNVLLENRFRVISEIDRGAVGAVYRGKDEQRNLNVAIKFLIADPDKQDEETVQRFKQEAMLLNELHHENIVHIFAFGWHSKLGPYLIMEYIDGDSVKALIDHYGPMSVDDCIDILIQTCDGLQHAHEAGVLHRDLKPANLMIIEGRRKSLRILDFGIAKRSDPRKAIVLTQPGDVFGSPLYMSPEQCQGASIDERSDIYSLGCCAYEMLTARPPLEGDTWMATAVLHVTEKPKPPEQTNPAVPGELSRIVLRCLSKTKEERYENMTALQADLQALQGSRARSS